MSSIKSHDKEFISSFPENEKNIEAEESKSTLSFKDGLDAPKGEMKRNFSNLSLAMIGFSLTNSWLGISSSLVTGIQSGGPILIVYGILIVASVSVCIAITLGEMASAMPSAGGQYVWARVLAPKDMLVFGLILLVVYHGVVPFSLQHQCVWHWLWSCWDFGI